MQELIDPPRGDAVAVPFRMDMNIDDIPELLSSIAVVQEKITKDHTHRPGTVLARVSAFVSTAKHYDIAQNICSEETLRQKVKKRKQKTENISVQVVCNEIKPVCRIYLYCAVYQMRIIEGICYLYTQ